VPSHFDRVFEYATHVCQIRSSCPYHRVEGHRLSVASNLLQGAAADQNFMEGIITRDETWVYVHDP
jgi:hypothetical protein